MIYVPSPHQKAITYLSFNSSRSDLILVYISYLCIIVHIGIIIYTFYGEKTSSDKAGQRLRSAYLSITV